ncbi:phosphatase PAP2 family protein [Schaalia sp. 19OD2882]|uniref:phosphatase PAP2 family protein n=1 Tax=Schaalia sp. 19OD2882 TaxID=2794089 RepID=UPI001C1E8F1E|nr:phosphatase PAP2 family protein [Schaalia sp. 19OD2882]QWW20227.1 phosphatase PAP2 family protein [Schaalia sp. 19OD2882]
MNTASARNEVPSASGTPETGWASKRVDALTLGTALVGVALTVALGMWARTWSGDLTVTAWFNSAHTTWVGPLADAVYRSLKLFGAIALAVAMSGIIAVKNKDMWVGVHYGAAVLITWAPVNLLKLVFKRPRPLVHLLPDPSGITPTDWSFPSGHTTFVATLVAVGVLMSRSSRLRRLVAGLGVVCIAAIAGMVMVVGVHFPSDVLGALVWAAGVAPLTVALGSHLRRWRLRRRCSPEALLQPHASTGA